MFQIDGYKISGGCYYKNNVATTNFTLEVLKIVTNGTDKFMFLLDTGYERIEMTVSSSQLKGRRFFNDMPVSITEEEEERFYSSLRKAVLKRRFTEEETIYETGKNGLQEVCGKRAFVFSNGSICDAEFNSKIYSGKGGAYFPEESLVDLDDTNKTVQNLFEQYNRNAEVFYPLFLYNIMSVSNQYFHEIGEPAFMKLTLWIDGASGSGKTELAKCAGNYVFRDAALNHELVSVTAKRKYALARLSESSGMTYILDDVKKESVRERRNSVRNIVDDVVRSVFQGRVTDIVNGSDNGPEKIDACAVITGEYLETNESQNARLFYLKTDGFLKQKSNSDALRVLQEHPLWLTTVCGGYIRWFLKKTKESSFPELLKSKLKELRAKESRYTEINNAERLKENVHMLEMAAVLAEMYFQEIELPEKFLVQFYSNTQKAVKKISDDTFCLLGGEKMVLLKLLENIFAHCFVREAEYCKTQTFEGMWTYKQTYFWINRKDDLVWISDYGKSLEKRRENRHDIRNTGAFLLIREKRFMGLFQAEIKNLLDKAETSSEIINRLCNNCTKMLREFQIIFKQYRTDSSWGRAAAEYPVFEWKQDKRRSISYDAFQQSYGNDYDEDEREENWDYDEEDEREAWICMVSKEPVMQINIAHPLVQIVKNRIGLAGCEPEIIFDRNQRWGICGMEKDEIWKLRKAFASGKELYRK